VARRHARERSRRAHRREQVKLLSERHVDASEPGPDRGRDRALDRDPGRSDRIQRLIGQEITVYGEGDGARLSLDPFDP
jgi:hypothetical protein